MAQHHLGAVHVAFDGVDRPLDDQLDADRRRQVEHHVGGIDQFGGERLVEHGVDHVAELRLRLQMDDVVDRAGGEVVDHLDAMAGSEQRLGQMGADEAGAAGDEHTLGHGFYLE